MATASVKLICGGEEKAEAATGNGPVDAVYQAINRITDYPIELVKYQLTAKAMAATRWARWISWSHTTAAASTA